MKTIYAVVLLLLALLISEAGHASSNINASSNDSDNWSDENWDDDSWDDEWQQQPQSRWQPITGFAQLAYGRWLNNETILPINHSLNELRLRLETAYQVDSLQFNFKVDALYDEALSDFNFRIRQAVLDGNLSENVALKAGRQILSWGTGDLLFVNDLFRKDWQSFFNGRDDQYLKAAVDAIKLSYFGEQVSLDLIWQPRFSSDRYLTGERFSFYDSQTKTITAPMPSIEADEPSSGAIAARLYFSYQHTDIAFYFNRGYSGTPSTTAKNSFYLPQLSSLGASMITPLATGLFNVETAYHNYQHSDPTAPTDQIRLLLGYQQELMPRVTLAGQFYIERYKQHRAVPEDASRQVITLRLSHRSSNDKWFTTLFGFVSPNQHDSYLRTAIRYRANDQLQIALGINIFNGSPSRFFGQLYLNDNAYLRLTYYY